MMATREAKKILSDKIDDLHKLAKALLVYETLSGEEIKNLLINNIQPVRTKDDDIDKILIVLQL